MLQELVEEFKKNHPPGTDKSHKVKYFTTDQIVEMLTDVQPEINPAALARALKDAGYQFRFIDEGMKWITELA